MAKLVMKSTKAATRTTAPAPKKSGTKAFEGTLKNSRVLIDAGNGEVVLKLKEGKPLAEQAQKAGYTIIVRDKASHFAVRSYVNAWRKEHLGK